MDRVTDWVTDRTVGADGRISDQELAAEALAARAHDPFADDAAPFGADVSHGADLLPDWYMPVPQRSAADRSPRRTVVVATVVFALVLLNGAGLCVTYGLPEIAW